MKRIIKQIIPSPIKRSLRDTFRGISRSERKVFVSSLPRSRLKEKHIRNWQLVLDRRSMLEKIGNRGVVAELGVNRGKFSEVIIEVTKPRVLHLVDIWEKDRYHEGLYSEVSEKFRDRIESGNVQIHRGLSTEASTEFLDEYFDMIYIDTDHSYNTTRDELLAYAPKIREGGYYRRPRLLDGELDKILPLWGYRSSS